MTSRRLNVYSLHTHGIKTQFYPVKAMLLNVCRSKKDPIQLPQQEYTPVLFWIFITMFLLKQNFLLNTHDVSSCKLFLRCTWWWCTIFLYPAAHFLTFFLFFLSCVLVVLKWCRMMSKGKLTLIPSQKAMSVHFKICTLTHLHANKNS